MALTPCQPTPGPKQAEGPFQGNEVAGEKVWPMPDGNAGVQLKM
jgi:hypothetical protein